jgi:hypothetical protein
MLEFRNLIKSKAVFTISLLFVCLIISLLLTHFRDYHSSDFGYYWVASRLLLDGGDPYKVSVWMPIAKAYGTDADLVISFSYPLPMILLFLPLATLDLSLAAGVWIFLLTAIVLSSIVILLNRFEKENLIKVVIPLVAGILLYRPLISTFYWGQMTSLVFFTLTISAFLIDKGKWKSGAAILPLLLIKPQIGIPILGLFTFWLMLRGQWKAILVETISTFIFLAPAFFYNPGWVGSWLSSGGNSLQIVFGYAPTLWGLGMLVCQGQFTCGFSLAIVLSISALVAGIYLLVRFQKEEVFFVFGIMATTVLLITPYLLANDLLVILLPFLVAIQRLQREGFPYIPISSSTIILSLTTIGLVPWVHKFQSDAPTTVISILSLLLIGYTLQRTTRSNLIASSHEELSNHIVRTFRWIKK